jgi:cell division protein FtsL
MQENNSSVKRNVNARNKANNVIVSSKNSSPVAKRKNNAISAKRVSNLHAVRAPKVVNVKKQDKAPFPWSVVVVAVIMTGLFLFMMMNYAEVNKYKNEIVNLDAQITTMEKNHNELQGTLNKKNNLTEYGEYATESLGMVPGNQIVDRKVITVVQSNTVEMTSYDDGEEGGIGVLLSGFGEVIRDFID